MFGLSTTVIAAIAVLILVLVLVLLIILSARQKRAKALAMRLERPTPHASQALPEPPKVDSTAPFTAFTPTPLGDETSEPEQLAAAMEPDLEWDARPAVVEAAAATVAPPAAIQVPAPLAPPTVEVPLADPVAYLITSLLQGQGDLTEAELRRLELYRPTRVIMVADELKNQLTGKDRDVRIGRLARIQQYAETLRVRAEEHTAPEPTASSVPVAETPSQPATYITSELNLDHELSLLPPEPIITAATVPSAAPSPPLPEEPGLAVAEPPAAAAATTGLAWATAETPATEHETEEMIVEERVPFAEDSMAAPLPVQETSAMPADDTGFGWEEWRPAEEPTVIETTTPEPAAAEDPVSLPVDEGPIGPAGLTPVEISQALKQTQDKDFKMAAIRTLEANGSPDALFAINECLEDPDPDVQMSALEAAERLLKQH